MCPSQNQAETLQQVDSRTDWQGLTTGATRRVVDMLKAHGNEPSREHIAALRVLMQALTGYAMGERTGRVAFGLGTGLGKTTAIVAWVATLLEHEPTDVGVTVAAFKVEALCELKRKLLAAGVDESQIGLQHSYDHDPQAAKAYLDQQEPLPDRLASEPRTRDNDERSVVLVTHNRVKAEDELESDFHFYGDEQRRLLIWDESFETSAAEAIDTTSFKGDLLTFKRRCHQGREAHHDLTDLIRYLSDSVDLLERKQGAASNDGKAIVATLPELDRQQKQSFTRLLSRQRDTGNLANLIKSAGTALRVIPAPRSVALRYELTVPRELKNVVILDASYPIRQLVRLDPSVCDADDLPETKRAGVEFSQLKSYSEVTIHHMNGAGGRTALTQDFAGERAVAADVIDVLRDIPDDQDVLIFTFKERTGEVDMRSVLERAIEKAGIPVDRDDHRRVFLETWGNETSLNRYTNCRHVILAGVIRQDRNRLAATTLGQQDTLEANLLDEELKEIDDSEVAHAIYQAGSRGTMRLVRDGKAWPMDLWVITKTNGFKRYLQKVMPEACWVSWYGNHHDGGKTGRMAENIANYLDKQPTGSFQRISTRQIKSELFPDDRKNDRTFGKAIDQALLGMTQTPWEREGRSLVRLDRNYYCELFEVNPEDSTEQEV